MEIGYKVCMFLLLLFLFIKSSGQNYDYYLSDRVKITHRHNSICKKENTVITKSGNYISLYKGQEFVDKLRITNIKGNVIYCTSLRDSTNFVVHLTQRMMTLRFNYVASLNLYDSEVTFFLKQ